MTFLDNVRQIATNRPSLLDNNQAQHTQKIALDHHKAQAWLASDVERQQPKKHKIKLGVGKKDDPGSARINVVSMAIHHEPSVDDASQIASGGIIAMLFRKTLALNYAQAIHFQYTNPGHSGLEPG